MCDHRNFKVQAHVFRLTEDESVDSKVTGYTTDIQIHCADCFKPFVWVGVPGGSSPVQPMVNFDSTVLRAPIKPVI